MAATDIQMQNYADQRIRRRAEQIRNLINSLLDDKASIDEIYQRAVSNNAWNDNRTDGPPTLLQSGNSSNPDHMLAYNSFISQLLWIFNDVGDPPENTLEAYQGLINALRGNWAVVIDACVRPVGD